MDWQNLSTILAGLPVPQFRFYASIGSTNDEALHWAAEGAVDGCLVIADTQTNGRGRLNRKWVTQPGAALAFSLILRPSPAEAERLNRFPFLAALAVCLALEETAGLETSIKWPNDVLIQQRKAAGILVETGWSGDRLDCMVVGVGVNVTRDAVPEAEEVRFPATSVEDNTSTPVKPGKLLRSILQHLFDWRSRLADPEFHQELEKRLAFRKKWVRIEEGAGRTVTGQVVGLDPSGALILRAAPGKNDKGDGQLFTVTVGDLHLALLDS